MTNIHHINPFRVTGLFLYPLKTSKNQRFFYVFRGYRKIRGMKFQKNVDVTSKVIKIILQLLKFLKLLKSTISNKKKRVK